ncbi:phosphoglycolate phosphatase [Thiosulfatihalobacter marinus]|uniref:phosphoglycolate phosphatase n=1 Tax=Thiosulfatihalobacter marinus TaxID=2792481 RepID=UPI001E45A8EE|nr:phosphoglycolate phosphatase [Thiosulfatihalobacter marinus]
MGLVIFDLDGTLVDSVADMQGCVNRMLSAEGLAPLDLPTFLTFVGNGLPHLINRVIAARDIDPDQFQRLHDIVLRLYMETPPRLTRVYPGVIAALDRLAAMGLRLGICTNKAREPARHLLEALNLSGYFATVIGGDSLSERKPHPLPLLSAVRAMGGGPVLYVGDSEVDAETARRAELPFALYTEGYRKSPVARIAHDHAFADFAELPAIAARTLGIAA